MSQSELTAENTANTPKSTNLPSSSFARTSSSIFSTAESDLLSPLPSFTFTSKHSSQSNNNNSRGGMPTRTALFSFDAQDEDEYSFAKGDQLVLCKSRRNSLPDVVTRSSTSEFSDDGLSPKPMPPDDWVRMKRIGSISNGGYVPRQFLQSIENTFVYAIEDYKAQLEDELSFQKYEKIEVVSKSIVPEEGYALGRLITGEIGVFPLYVTQIDKPDELLYIEEAELDDAFEPSPPKQPVTKTVSAPVQSIVVPRSGIKRTKERKTVKDLARMFETLDEKSAEK